MLGECGIFGVINQFLPKPGPHRTRWVGTNGANNGTTWTEEKVPVLSRIAGIVGPYLIAFGKPAGHREVAPWEFEVHSRWKPAREAEEKRRRRRRRKEDEN